MLVTNFGSLMAIPTDPPYCLMYPNTYSNKVVLENQNHFNTMGGPPRLCTGPCICHTLLQHADLTEAHRQKYNGSHLIVPRGAQYKTLLPKITMPHNHRAPLLDLHSWKPFPMVPVGDFSLKDKIFPCAPGGSLLFNGDELTKLDWEMCPVQPARRGSLLSPAGDLPRLHHQRCPQTHQTGSLHTAANAPLHLRSSMTSMRRIHTVCPSSARTSLAVTGAAKTKKVTSLCRSTPCLHPNGSLPLKE